MKKFFLTLAMMVAFMGVVNAQGRFEVKDMDNFKLHTYYTNDPMGDAAFIVETANGLVTIDAPLLKDNWEEFSNYARELHKHIDYNIINFHEGGDPKAATMRPEGMTKFMSEGMYDSMMKGFQQNFGDKMLDRPSGPSTEIKFGETLNSNGVTYKFEQAPAGGFPGATIIIGEKIRHTHSAPNEAHITGMSAPNAAAVDVAIDDLQKALASGCELFIGSHGGAVNKAVVENQLEYLQTVQRLLKQEKTADAFVAALKKAYPGKAGEDALPQVAANLYK